jgi:hypothetical protein
MHDRPGRPHLITPDLAGGIRRFYLLPEESYSLHDLADAWRLSSDDVYAIFSDELSTADPAIANEPGVLRVSRQAAVRAAHTFHVFRAVDVEVALGDDFEKVRGSRWRTVPVLLRLPRCIVDALRLLPYITSYNSVAARAERLLCETVEAQIVLQGTTSRSRQ